MKATAFSNTRTTHTAAINMAAMEGKSIGIIGMGDMGKMYARRLSDAGWKYVSSRAGRMSLRAEATLVSRTLFSLSLSLLLHDDRECIWLECGDMAVLEPFWRQTPAVLLPLM